MIRKQHGPKHVQRLSDAVEVEPTRSADFSDAESQRVLTAAARAVAWELGREAAREHFAKLVRTTSAPNATFSSLGEEEEL